MGDFKNLIVWQKAHKLSLSTVENVETIKGNTGSIVRNQLLRSVTSIENNLAEGSAKRSDREFARYVRIALGSLTETENHLILLKDLSLIGEKAFNQLNSQVQEVGRMLNGLEKRLSDDADN